MSDSLPTLDLIQDYLALPKSQRQAGVEIVGPWASGKALAAAQLAQEQGLSLLYITAGRMESEHVFDDLSTFIDPDRCFALPAWEVLPTDAMEPADDIVAERMNALNALNQGLSDKEPVYLSISVRSFLQRVANQKQLHRDTIDLRMGEEHDLEKLALRFAELGYTRELMVEQRGDFSIRGDILDVFPISGELPYRVEFFGDEIEAIRRFEPETQRSVDDAEVVHLLPRSEKALLAEQADGEGLLGTIADYFGPDTLIAIDEPLAVKAEAEKLQEQFGGSPFMTSWDEVMGRLKNQPQVTLAQVAHDPEPGTARIHAPMLSVTAWQGNTDGFWEQLEEWEQGEYAVQLYCHNTGERRRILELLREHGYRPGRDKFDLRLAVGRIGNGFSSPKDKLAVLSEREMFGRKSVRRVRRRFQAGAAITQFSDVSPGDYIVHIDHGIGRYLGLQSFKGKPNEFMAIQYTGGDVMYVPVTHIDQVQKYVGGGGSVPKMDRIGGATWSKTRGKVKKAVQEMTEELVKLYAAREAVEKAPCGADTHWQDEFEDSFEYEETPDQLRAAAEIKRDLESPKPTERLLCGDVGYGKTEVAMRAAFKMVMAGKQVAVLVPTTVLAEQHYKTFSERFADYPVKIDMLSRFRSPAETRDIVKKLREKELDIIIGTHRLTSGDIQFADLGLVVLDEEQRFGVKHKEKLKKMKTDVDVLAMTATPIPRTMHMSLSGVRDMSVINTAPNDRLPIHTCIEVYDKQLIAEAITRELAREGQVFYLHNRVKTIDKVAAQIKKLVPQARVSVGHGQMKEDELEDVMTGFVRHESDVLVCTTIIGSGLDIPNANTIIVDRADMFGLAELYQIRGRVGRYKHRAFAYLLIPGDKALSEEAQQRLKALEEFSTLGSGFRIAMRDLEIRGCGNLLGAKQSGQIAAVGYEMYSQLIAEAVAEIKGQPSTARYLPPFDITADAGIPDEYIELESQKITLYKRITGLKSEDEIDEMYDELKDRFGDVPETVKMLLEIMRARVLGGEAGAKKLFVSKSTLTMRFGSTALFREGMPPELKSKFGDRLQVSLHEAPSLILPLENGETGVDEAQAIFRALVDAE